MKRKWPGEAVGHGLGALQVAHTRRIMRPIAPLASVRVGGSDRYFQKRYQDGRGRTIARERYLDLKKPVPRSDLVACFMRWLGLAK